MKKLRRQLAREFPFAEIELTRSNHYRIALPNGRAVIVAATPGCRNTMHNARADVRRQMRRRPSRDLSLKQTEPSS